MSFNHPTRHERMTFTAPPPADTARLLEALRGGGAARSDGVPPRLSPFPRRVCGIDPLQVALAGGADLEAGGQGPEADVAGAVGSPLEDAAQGVDAGRWRGSLQ